MTKILNFQVLLQILKKKSIIQERALNILKISLKLKMMITIHL